jgi:hypothetical protein
MKLEELESIIINNQLMIHILNKMISDYDLQLAIMEKHINDKVNPLTIDEIRGDLNLHFKRLNMKAMRKMRVKLLWTLRYSVVSLSENTEIVVP